MFKAARLVGVILGLVGSWILATHALAGPPYLTDDPEPVDYRHWEVYFASLTTQLPSGYTGTSPHVEVNYGAAPNLQLHTIVPYAFSAAQGTSAFGLGDIELGAKYRFVREGRSMPMVGTFPLLEVPAGNAARGLGTGHLHAYLPIWLQKSWGPWQTYGGGGYWINPGLGNRDYWFSGCLIQRDLSPHLTLGNEIYYTSSPMTSEPRNLNFNFGGQYNFDDGHHLLFSAGRSILGATGLTTYAAYQWTFGPREKQGKGT